MNKIFWGLIFMFFSFTFSVNGAIVFDFLPDFVGYLLILAGFLTLSKKDLAFDKQIPVVFLAIFAIYNLVQYVVAYAHVAVMPDVSSLFYIITMLFIYQAVRDSEHIKNELRANNLYKSFVAYVVTLVLFLIAMMVLLSTRFNIFAVLSGLLTISNVAISIWYTVAFSKTARLHKQRELTFAAQQKSTQTTENSTDSI